MNVPHLKDGKPINLADSAVVDKAVKENGGKPVTVSVYLIQGIFGELPNCHGVAEAVLDNDEALKKYGLDPAEGGTFIKILGCSYLYKGDPKEERTFGIEQGKSMISDIPRDIIAKSVVYQLAVGFRFLFQRKKLIHDIHNYIESIRYRTIGRHGMADIRYNRYSKEIWRAMDIALKRELKIDPALNLYADCPPHMVKYSDVELAAVITKIARFGTLIMELDGAYKFPTQDTLGEKNTANAKRSGWREMLRLMDLLIERNTNLTIVPTISDRTEGVPNKFRFIKKVLRVLYFFSPMARRITQTFLVELDEKKVGLDEADWYFCLRRNTHNYRGVPLPLRLIELDRIDKERGHQYVQIKYVNQNNQPVTPEGKPIEQAPAAANA